MRKSTILSLIIGGSVIIASGFTAASSSGIAYYTNSPSDGATCSSCHSGGSTTPVASITASPAWGGSGNNLTYTPGTTYTITINQTSSYSGYGFDMEIMNTNSASGTTDAGTMTALNTTYLKNNGTGPTNVTHKQRIPTGTSVTVKWVAPASGTAYLYAAILGENDNGSTSGDKVVNVAYILTPAAAAPVAAFTSSSSSSCTGQSITLTDNSTNSPTSWAWTMTGGTPASSTSQNPTVSYSSAGTYTVSLVATNGGGSSAPVSHVITVNAPPAVTAPSMTMCSSQSSITLSASGASTYSWSTGGTNATCVVSPTSSTTYSVWGTSNGCRSAAVPVSVVVSNCTGISNYSIANQINIFPNPASDLLNINLGLLSGTKTVELYDVSGRLVAQKNTDGDAMQVELADVSKGTYFVKILNEKNIVAVKMIVVSK
jgi:PKD repeat protein